MNHPNPERESALESHESETPTFEDKFKNLLPGVEFEESGEMLEARTAILEALARNDQDPDFLRAVWTEYADVCEHAVDSKVSSDAAPQSRAKLQIAALVHKALIFRQIGDTQRYGEDLSDAEDYAFDARCDEIAEAIGIELDGLTAG